ncbi:MAG TPA: hypothetical protein PLM35_13205, partial [Cyclobacteriaceae bacterium]|nr:hypothetical protein [Cyclobacteriaceae bacterium]
TGMYYLRSTAAADAIKFTLDKKAVAQPTAATAQASAKEPAIAYASKGDEDQKRSDMACSLDNPDDCEACGS